MHKIVSVIFVGMLVFFANQGIAQMQRQADYESVQT